jgi:hypothetical protein
VVLIITHFFRPSFEQWKIFVGAILLLILFHFVVSFVIGRVPTSSMLFGMAIELAEKQTLGVLLVISLAAPCLLFAIILGLFFPHISDFGRAKRARSDQADV